MLGGQLEGVAYMDAADDEDAVFFFNFSRGLGYKPPFSGRNVTRFQRATKGAGQSTGSSGDDVVEGGGVGLVLRHVGPIVLGDVGVDAEANRFFFYGKVGAPERTAHALDADMGSVNNGVGHEKNPWETGD